MRTADGSGEVPVPAYELFSSTEMLSAMALIQLFGQQGYLRDLMSGVDAVIPPASGRNQVLRLVNDLLTLARADAGRELRERKADPGDDH